MGCGRSNQQLVPNITIDPCHQIINFTTSHNIVFHHPCPCVQHHQFDFTRETVYYLVFEWISIFSHKHKLTPPNSLNRNLDVVFLFILSESIYFILKLYSDFDSHTIWFTLKKYLLLLWWWGALREHRSRLGLAKKFQLTEESAASFKPLR